MKTTAQEFERIAQTLGRWHERSIDCMRDVMVGGLDLGQAAKKHGMSRPQARVLRQRFINRLRAAQIVKVTADEYMSGVGNLAMFRADLLKLRHAGYSTPLLLDFLKRNGVDITSNQLEEFFSSLGNGHENARHRKSKRRSR